MTTQTFVDNSTRTSAAWFQAVNDLVYTLFQVTDAVALTAAQANYNLKATPAARSSNTILAVADYGKPIIATSTFTQTLTAAATLGAGWYAVYRNDSTGVITLDPNGAETIDGAATVALNPGESCIIFCDGSNFKTIGRLGSVVRPCFNAVANGAQTINTGVTAKVQFNVENFDTNANYDPVTNYRFTPTVAGKYHVTVQVALNAMTVDCKIGALIYKNGVVFKEIYNFNPIAADIPFAIISETIDMNGTTDYLEGWCYNGSTNNQTFQATTKYNSFSAHLVG